jgi:MATE family multidrug resistance protein
MRARTKTIVDLALPIIGGMVSQNLMNLVDTAMVGSLGDAALAGVGLSAFVNFMSVAFITGLAIGVQALAARRFGAQQQDSMAVPLNGGLLVAVVLGLPLSVLLFLLAGSFYPYLNSDPAVMAEGLPYLQARLCAMPAVGMNFAFRGYFNGVNRSRVYLRTLLSMHLINVSLSYLLIFGKLGLPELGSLGAGVGTTAAHFFGTVIYTVQAWRLGRTAGFLKRLPRRQSFGAMFRVGVPNGIQQFFFAGGLTCLFWIVGQVGTRELAAANVLTNVMLLAILPGMGLGLAAASLVGQALGRKDPVDAARWGWEVVRLSVVILALIGLPMLLVPDVILSVFIHDSSTLELARWPLRITGATIAVEGVALVLQGALMGAGDSRRVMVVSIVLQWLLLLPVAWAVGPFGGFGLLGIWLAMTGHQIAQAVGFAVLWHRGRWRSIQI